MKRLVWLFLIFHCMPCMAHTGNTVQIFRMSNNQFYSVPLMYHSLVQYYIDPNATNVTFEFRGHTYTVDTRRYMEGAMNQWMNATVGLDFPLNFSPVTTVTQANLVISAIFNEQDVPGWVPPNADGYAFPRDANHPFARVALIANRIPQSLEDCMDVSEYSVDALIRIWFRNFFIHEVGHTLGFDHPGHEGAGETQHGILPNVYFQVHLDHAADYEIPHIMTRSITEYITDREDELGRPVTEADVVISPVEVAAFRYAMTALAGVCEPPHTAFPSRGSTKAAQVDGAGSVRCSWGQPGIVSAVGSLLLN
ncbi:hypothetical protein [Dyella choica]|uniref:Peptidase metallopeptidase domain-containing protein n=1 Tax=Dyella choica TaxID=1927959 RepID=A0A3S0RM50_9GAMM|nr:hypothetical protein [Dyella choica]RUL78203.1 hypothetical protein EKH80_05010 [Dyella choica]